MIDLKKSKSPYPSSVDIVYVRVPHGHVDYENGGYHQFVPQIFSVDSEMEQSAKNLLIEDAKQKGYEIRYGWVPGEVLPALKEYLNK